MARCHQVNQAKSGPAIFNSRKDKYRLIKDIEENNGKKMIIKSLPNSFYNAELNNLLSLTFRKQLIFSGFMSHM
ncbi:isochorismatase family protein [Xenorhabdus sp. Reich]|uniref:Isochorismatase family protein n=1 Tax=Xenorhabdus littoralis TaxID=2582835 RepID=A0ABU4SHV2_9GAMM|nr:hypothetical protein [Xenorhabdus sp. Reich]MDX7998232.1 isochorismatase family protein [Xenorhabdus sp. Reich]